MFASSTPVVLERLSQYGHLVKKLVVHAFSSKRQVTFPQQLDWTVACLSACDNLKDLTLRIYQANISGGYGSLATVFKTLATRASKLEILLIDPTWNSLDGLEQLGDVLLATAHLQELYIGDRGFKVRYIDDSGCLRYHLQARRIPQLPPLPVLTNLSIPNAVSSQQQPLPEELLARNSGSSVSKLATSPMSQSAWGTRLNVVTFRRSSHRLTRLRLLYLRF